ncbi:GAF domain-containing protein [Pseudonocardia hierapolitana]|uniref:GAF domain-containing protein n=1 Tax=Pseudonocardia hierapolitana TaxID=1128676 RepID=A0A561T0N5_9PSEU|nr:GAF and ANTAR domain-containing protein [Pseudonocardia hierapolitana]TWF80669.1 GAF domain-containing protein [Pseudonocardia hierapolitana]
MTDAGQEGRERVLTEAFVSLADTLVTDFDVIDLLHRLCNDSVALLPVDAAGLMLSDQRGTLRVVSSSTEQAHLVELFQLQANEGPCLDCFHTSRQVVVADLDDEARWPRFVAHAREAGYRSVHALPLRLRSETIGGLNLFASTPGELSPHALRVGQALADVATIGILQERALRRQEMLAEQLQGALNSRVIIEQAKGMLAERGRIELDQAFTLLRAAARSRQRRLSDLARDIVSGAVISGVLPDPPRPNE